MSDDDSCCILLITNVRVMNAGNLEQEVKSVTAGNGTYGTQIQIRQI